MPNISGDQPTRLMIDIACPDLLPLAGKFPFTITPDETKSPLRAFVILVQYPRP